MTKVLSPAAECILSTVKRLGSGTSFVEVGHGLDEAGIPSAGDVSIDLGVSNLTAWVGMSEEFFAGVGELIDARLIHFTPTSLLVYLIDGGMPNLPMAQRVPKGGYRDPHWIPVTFCLGPNPNGKASP